MSAPDSVELRYRVAPGYYMYRERFGITISPYGAATLGEAVYPKGEVKYDPTFEKDMEVYHQDVIVRVPVQPGGQAFTLTATSQGCADAGLCYPPMDHSVKLTPVQGGYAVAGGALAGAGAAASAGASAGGLGGLLSAGDTGLADALGGLGWAKTAGVFLVLGLLLAFTPCVLPMIPILSSIVVGGAARRQARARTRTGPGRHLRAGYVRRVHGAGVAAGLSGAGLAAWLQTPWILSLFAALLAVLALAMFDVFTFQMPSGIQARLSERSSRIPGGRYTGALLMGALSALIVGLCVAAPLAGALLYISQTGDVVLGGSALFAMAWGMGVLLLIVGASSARCCPRPARGWTASSACSACCCWPRHGGC